MKIKDKIKTYSFWVSLASAVILILKVLGSRFGFTVDESMVSDAFTAICSILVLLGIIVVPTNQEKNYLNQTNKNCQDENNQDKIQIELNSKLDNEISNNICEIEIKPEENFINLNTQESASNSENKEDITATSDIILNETKTVEHVLNTDIISEKIKTTEHALILEEPTQTNNTNQINPELIDGSSEDNQDDFTEVNNEKSVIENLENSNNSIIEPKEDLNSVLAKQRENFANNINNYILQLQEEIRKVREGM